MRLTNTIREAFVAAVMNDVPKEDFDEVVRKAVIAKALALCPPAVAKLWEDAETRRWIEKNTAYVARRSISIPTPSDYDGRELFKSRVENDPDIQRLEKMVREQEDRRDELRNKLKGCAQAATTRKQLAEMLPEFEKYLPEDEAKANRQLPVVANVVAEFVKAGWPKGQEAPKQSKSQIKRHAALKGGK